MNNGRKKLGAKTFHFGKSGVTVEVVSENNNHHHHGDYSSIFLEFTNWSSNDFNTTSKYKLGVNDLRSLARMLSDVADEIDSPIEGGVFFDEYLETDGSL